MESKTKAVVRETNAAQRVIISLDARTPAHSDAPMTAREAGMAEKVRDWLYQNSQIENPPRNETPGQWSARQVMAQHGNSADILVRYLNNLAKQEAAK